MTEVERLIRRLYFQPPSAIMRYREFINSQTDPGLADSILVQAYGRDSYSDKELFETLVRLVDFDDPERSFEILAENKFKAGIANTKLAEETLGLWRPHHVVIAQWEVCFELWQMDPDWYKKAQMYCLWPTPQYFNTVAVKTLSRNIMRRPKISLSHPIELAHPQQIVRAMTILWKLGLRPLPWVSLVPFDPNSVQLWTKNGLTWFVWEALVRPLHLAKKWSVLVPPSGEAPC